MDPGRFDRLAQVFGAETGRRGVVGVLIGIVLGAGAVDGADARRRHADGGSRGVGAQRKRNKKKRRNPPCAPRCEDKRCGPDGCGGNCGVCDGNTACDAEGQCTCVPACAGKVCGGNGCVGGSCGLCPEPTVCNAQGRCVECLRSSDCPLPVCTEASCVMETCLYQASADGAGCGESGTCCAQACVDTQTDRLHCGGCDRRCTSREVCDAGQCVACDVCDSGCRFSELQRAIDAAPNGGTVRLCAGTYTGTATIFKDVTVVGIGALPADTVLRFEYGPILAVTPGATVTVRNLTVTGAIPRANFPAIEVSSASTLRLEAVRVVENGGAIYNVGTLTLADCLVADNFSQGGIVNENGTVTLFRTRITGNEGSVAGGIYNRQGILNVTENSVVTGNTGIGPPSVGGVRNDGTTATVTIDGTSRVTGNTPNDCINTNGGTGCPAPPSDPD